MLRVFPLYLLLYWVNLWAMWHQVKKSTWPVAESATGEEASPNHFTKPDWPILWPFCDVDMGAPHTEEVMKMFPNVPRFKDFREMFDKMGKDIEAVSVGTPDFFSLSHYHAGHVSGQARVCRKAHGPNLSGGAG